MDLRIVTLDRSNALKLVEQRQTREERQRRKDWRTAKLQKSQKICSQNLSAPVPLCLEPV